MTITHPCHPLRGRQLPLLRVRNVHDAALVVRFPDGAPAAIPADWTEDILPAMPGPEALPRPLLEGAGLRQVVRLLHGPGEEGRVPNPAGREERVFDAALPPVASLGAQDA